MIVVAIILALLFGSVVTWALVTSNSIRPHLPDVADIKQIPGLSKPRLTTAKRTSHLTPAFKRVRVTGQPVELPAAEVTPKAGKQYFVNKGRMKARVVKDPLAPCWITGQSRSICPCKECKNDRAKR